MFDQSLPDIPLPSGCAKNVKLAILHVISLAPYAIVTAWAHPHRLPNEGRWTSSHNCDPTAGQCLLAGVPKGLVDSLNRGRIVTKARSGREPGRKEKEQ